MLVPSTRSPRPLHPRKSPPASVKRVSALGVVSVLRICLLAGCAVLPSSSSRPEDPSSIGTHPVTVNLSPTPTRTALPPTPVPPTEVPTRTIPISGLEPGDYILFTSLNPCVTSWAQFPVHPMYSLTAFNLGSRESIQLARTTDPWPDLSPDGHYLAYNDQLPVDTRGEEGSQIRIIDLETSISTLLSQRGQVSSWSPTGDALALTVADQERVDVAIAPVASTELHFLTQCQEDPADEADCGGPSWAPNGRRIAFSRAYPRSGPIDRRSGIYLIPASCVDAPDTCSALARGPFGRGVDPAWSADGRLIAWDDLDSSDIVIFDAQSSVVASRVHNVGWASFIVWSPDSDALAISDTSEIALIDIRTERQSFHWAPACLNRVVSWIRVEPQ
jgi:hypothetical protein